MDELQRYKIQESLINAARNRLNRQRGAGGYMGGPTAGGLGMMRSLPLSNTSSNFGKLLEQLYGNGKKKKLIGITNQAPGSASPNSGGITVGKKKYTIPSPGIVPPGMKLEDWDVG